MSNINKVSVEVDKIISKSIIGHFMAFIKSKNFVYIDCSIDIDQFTGITWANEAYKHSRQNTFYIKGETNLSHSKLIYHTIIHKDKEGVGLIFEENKGISYSITKYDPSLGKFEGVKYNFEPCLTLLLKIIENK